MRLDDFTASIDQVARARPDPFTELLAAAANEIAASASAITQFVPQLFSGYRSEKHCHGGADADA
jgi:hypothetical protein